jgi:predicted N-acyltransferase
MEAGRPIAVVPAFTTIYRLDTTVQGPMKRLMEAFTRLLPGLFSIRLACFGSPVAEVCHLGFAPGVDDARKPALLRRLADRLQEFARDNGIGLLAVKDVRDEDAPLWECALPAFQRTPGLPTATLALPFKTPDDYLGSLSPAMRKDMRRKLRTATAIRVEYRTVIDDVSDRVAALYEETVARSDFRFERLPPAYFSNVLAAMHGKVHCVLYWRGPELLAFNLVLQSERILLDKFVGMRADARDYNLYFLSWMENVRRCIAMRLPFYQSGQAGYAVKLRLGSTLKLNWSYFMHLNPLLNGVLRIVSRLVRLDRFDPELRAALQGLK